MPKRLRPAPPGVVDLPRVKRALAKLDRLARKHPEAFRLNAREWERVLEEDEMVAAKMVAFRLPEELIEQLEKYAARLAAETGITVTLSDVIRKLLAEGVSRAAAKRKRKR
jgi:hypothetical protein